MDKVLMHANDMLKYRDKIIEAFRDGTFSSEHLKKSDAAAYDYVFKDVNNFIQKIKSMSENINPSLFNEFFELSPADYAKRLINVKNPNENKETVAEIEDRISYLKDRIKNGCKRKKHKNADETLKIIEEILDSNKNSQKFFSVASKVHKGKSEPKPEESIAKRVHLRREKAAKVKREERNLKNKLFQEYFIIYQSPSHMYKKLCKAEVERNEDQVYLIKEVLNRMKKTIENVPENKTFKIEENKNIINTVERILHFNQLEQKGQGLKILTPIQMLSNLPISLAQIKAGNNSEKLKNQAIIIFFLPIKKTYKTTL